MKMAWDGSDGTGGDPYSYRHRTGRFGHRLPGPGARLASSRAAGSSVPAHQPVNARPTLIPVALLLCLLPSRVAAQEPRANLGLPAAGALGVFAGRAWMERDGSG